MFLTVYGIALQNWLALNYTSRFSKLCVREWVYVNVCVSVCVCVCVYVSVGASHYVYVYLICTSFVYMRPEKIEICAGME